MYEQPAVGDLSQGDIIDDWPILVWKLSPPPLDLNVPPETRIIRVVVLTQACDLAQDKTTRVVVAPVHDAADLVAKNILKAGVIRDQVRRGQVFGWYFLPAASEPVRLAESIVDLRELHTIERRTLEYLVSVGKRVARIRTPWREHLGFIARVLPIPVYERAPADGVERLRGDRRLGRVLRIAGKAAPYRSAAE